MAINWINAHERHTIKNGADVSVQFANKRSVVSFTFSDGAVATKFAHAPRVLIGADELQTRLYFLPGEAGYKLTPRNKTSKAFFRVQTKKVETIVDRPSELIGDYNLTKDPDSGAWYIKIGACSVKGA